MENQKIPKSEKTENCPEEDTICILRALERTILNDIVLTGIKDIKSASMEIRKDILISILIPIRDKVELLRTCINSIIETERECYLEIIIIDNNKKYFFNII